jgi:hypothetical protein
MKARQEGVRPTYTSKASAFVAALIFAALSLTVHANEELRAVLERLDAHEANSQKQTPATSTSRLTSQSAAKPAAEAASKPAATPRATPSAGRTPQIDPKAKYYGTKDKLPRKIAGHPLVGEFFVLGEYINGGAVLYAVEDEGKGLFRQYVVVNLASGLSPGTYYDQGRRPKLSFSRKQPLIFVKKLFPGLYAVQVP